VSRRFSLCSQNNGAIPQHILKMKNSLGVIFNASEVFAHQMLSVMRSLLGRPVAQTKLNETMYSCLHVSMTEVRQ
jgi:hypothetical protein